PGFAPTPGDATWNYRMWNTDSWTTPGGDYVGTASATQAVNINPQFVTWSSQGLINDVQGWVDGTTSNFGWMIIGDEGTNGTSRRFVSSEAPNASFHPELTVDYILTPEPSSISLALIAGIALLSGRRRNFQAFKRYCTFRKKPTP